MVDVPRSRSVGPRFVGLLSVTGSKGAVLIGGVVCDGNAITGTGQGSPPTLGGFHYAGDTVAGCAKCYRIVRRLSWDSWTGIVWVRNGSPATTGRIDRSPRASRWATRTVLRPVALAS